MIGRRLFTGALAGVLAMPAIVRAAGLTPVTVRLDWLPDADHGALFLAKTRGHYKDVGLDVSILDGKGSVVALQSVASGNDTIGVANLSTMALAVSSGAPLIAIACILQKAPDCLIALKGSGITKPHDLTGKRWGFVPADAGARLFPAFARATGLDIDTLHRIQLSQSAAHTSLLVGNVDFISGWAIADALRISQVKPIETPILYADYGVNSLGNGFVVNKQTLGTKKDVFKAFLAATTKGQAEAQADPKAAVAALMEERPESNEVVATREAPMLKDYLHTPATMGRPYGWMAQSDWEQTAKLLRDCCQLSPAIKAQDLYTNDLLPA